MGKKAPKEEEVYNPVAMIVTEDVSDIVSHQRGEAKEQQSTEVESVVSKRAKKEDSPVGESGSSGTRRGESEAKSSKPMEEKAESSGSGSRDSKFIQTKPRSLRASSEVSIERPKRRKREIRVVFPTGGEEVEFDQFLFELSQWLGTPIKAVNVFRAANTLFQFAKTGIRHHAVELGTRFPRRPGNGNIPAAAHFEDHLARLFHRAMREVNEFQPAASEEDDGDTKE